MPLLPKFYLENILRYEAIVNLKNKSYMWNINLWQVSCKLATNDLKRVCCPVIFHNMFHYNYADFIINLKIFEKILQQLHQERALWSERCWQFSSSNALFRNYIFNLFWTNIFPKTFAKIFQNLRQIIIIRSEMINPLVKNAYKLLPKIFAIEMLASTNKK